MKNEVKSMPKQLNPLSHFDTTHYCDGQNRPVAYFMQTVLLAHPLN